jgi:prepilin-type N-terminal cleavage/methylation domain-containing protein
LSRTNDKGFTLIELIIFIIIGAIFLPASMVAFTSVMSNYSRPDYYVKARFYADKRMAEITSKPYDQMLCSALTADDDPYETTCDIQPINPFDLGTKSPSNDYKRIRISIKDKNSDSLIDEVSTIVTKRPNAS